MESNLVVKGKKVWQNTLFYKTVQKKLDDHFRKQLKNDQFTILCSNCIGGCIYHRLGKKFLTPTINMFFSQPDFVNFVLYIKNYVDLDLNFIKSDEVTPVATLGGGGYSCG